MDISTSGTQGRVAQLNSVEQANKLAVAQKTDQLSLQGVSFAVNLQAATAPAIYAQAAQYQLYTQSGSLAAILGAQNVGTQPQDAPIEEADTEIHAVEAPASSSVDTRA